MLNALSVITQTKVIGTCHTSIMCHTSNIVLTAINLSEKLSSSANAFTQHQSHFFVVPLCFYEKLWPVQAGEKSLYLLIHYSFPCFVINLTALQPECGRNCYWCFDKQQSFFTFWDYFCRNVTIVIQIWSKSLSPYWDLLPILFFTIRLLRAHLNEC